MSRPTPTRQRFGRYETLFRFASGGMAEVFAARATGAAGFERLVALKRILPNMNDDERVIDMFLDEGRLAANVTSSHVVSTLDLGRADDGSLYIVMDLVIGAPLSRLMANAMQADEGGPSPSVATEIIRQAARGLHDAHEATTPTGEPLNLIHRDVSPQNILVGSDGRVQITDFGIARSEGRKTQTSTGEFKGKLTYYSPEQTANRPLDRRCDIFALGIVGWEILTGRRLFAADNPLAVLDQVMNMPIVPPHEMRPEVPAEVSAVIMKALERDRDHRYQTAAELEEALRAAAAASLPHCSRADLCAFVSKHGGETLERIQAEIKAALAHPGPGDELAAAPPPTTASYTWLLRAGAVAAVVAVAAGVALVMNEAESTSPALEESPEMEAEPVAPAVAASAAPPTAIEPSPPQRALEPAAEPAPPPRRAAPHRAARRSPRARVEEHAPAQASVPAQDPPREPAAPRLGANRAPILR